MGNLDWPRDGRHIFVGGKWIELHGVESISAISPIDEQIIGSIAAARAEDVEHAVETITPALRDWAGLGAVGRAAYLTRLADAVAAHSAELAELETIDAGLTVRTANRDLTGAIASLKFYASYAHALTAKTYPDAENVLAYTVREPYGIVARITPFNHPVLFAASTAAPVLLAGNAVILKPPEQASLSTLALAEIAREIFPPGVFNVITGYGHETGSAIVAHPSIPRIGFTGSVPTGRRILEGAAAHIKHVSLELGGKNPLIIAEGADPDFASNVALLGMNFTHAGQSCQSTSRVLICSDLYDEVVDGLAGKMQALVVGDPRDQTTDTGPVAFKAHYDRVLGYIAIGTDEGAKLVVGGNRPEGFSKGFYIEPTLFSEVSEDMRIAKEEIFGPVVVAMRYENLDDAIRIANDTEFGLLSRVVAGSLDAAAAIGREIKAGATLLNTEGNRPRGMPVGAFKQSGLGTEGCLEEVLSYSQEKAVVARI